MGVWGADDCERPLREALTGINPQGIFGCFLGKQKATRLAGRNPLRITYPCRHNPAASYIQWK